MFEENIPLKLHSNYKIGGPAKYFFNAKNTEEIIRAVGKARQLKSPIFILGRGTNILFSDDIFNGLILKPDIQFIERKGNLIRVGTGTPMIELIDYFIGRGLAGLEWAAGLPGTLGGAIRGNAGCFGGEAKDIIKEVISLDVSKPAPKIIKRNNADCDFNYRSSVFKKKPFGEFRAGEIILEAVLIAKKGDKKLMEAVAQKNLNYRKQNQPLEHPNIGSIFKNVPLTRINADLTRTNAGIKKVIKNDPFPLIPAAYLISEAGLRGVSFGGAMISPKHPNFIVNVLNAASQDVKNLISLVKKEVYKKFKINLEEEIEILG